MKVIFPEAPSLREDNPIFKGVAIQTELTTVSPLLDEHGNLSQVHQLFGRYAGWAFDDRGQRLEVQDLIGFAEEHRARW